MAAAVNRIPEINEPNSARMNFRTKPRIKATIQRAAAMSGMDDSTFTMNAAYRLAMETIEAHERTVLQPGDLAAFFDALDNPPPPNEKLRAAFARYKDTIESR